MCSVYLFFSSHRSFYRDRYSTNLELVQIPNIVLFTLLLGALISGAAAKVRPYYFGLDVKRWHRYKLYVTPVMLVTVRTFRCRRQQCCRFVSTR
jgi:hypothetical protein